MPVRPRPAHPIGLESSRPKGGGVMIDHVTANVGDFEQAKRFYTQALAPLGYSVQMEFEGAAGFGTGEGIPDFWIGSSPERGAAHVAFGAGDHATVDAFHDAAMAAMGRTTGLPDCARTITRATTRPTYTMRTATTSRPSATCPGDVRLRGGRGPCRAHPSQAARPLPLPARTPR